MLTVGPFVLVLGVATLVKPPSSQGAKVTGVVLSNASPFTCTVSIVGPQHWLQPFTSDYYDVAPNGAGSILVTPLTALAGAGADTNLTADFYNSSDTVPGNYPMSLTAQAISSAITGVVSLTAGTSVAISGTPAVTVSGTPSVAISGTPSVAISGPVAISGTPTVDIANTPAVTVASGSVAISGTPSVAISGPVAISGTPSVAIAGTPSVAIASGSVGITGTPSVAIASGSVNIGSAPIIDITNAGGTFLLTGDLPAVALVMSAGPLNWQTSAVGAGYRALVFTTNNAPDLVTVTGLTTGITYAFQAPVGAVSPTVVLIDPGADAHYNLRFALGGSNAPTCYAYADQISQAPGQVQFITASVINPTGAGVYFGLIITDATHVFRLMQLSWTIVASSATAAASYLIWTIYGFNGVPILIRGGVGASSTATAEGRIEFGSGLVLASSTPAPGVITCNGNGPGSAFGLATANAVIEVS